MLQFSTKKDFFLVSLLSLFLFSLINLYFLSNFHGIFAFFFSKNIFELNYLYFVTLMNYYFGFSFLPCLLICFYSLVKSSSSYFYLYFLNMLAFDFLFSLFGYGGGISTCVHLRFGMWITFFCFLILLSFSWLLCLYLILEFKKNERIEKKVSNSKVEIEKRNNIHLPNLNLLSVGKKVDIKINIEGEKLLLIKTLGEFGVDAKIIDVFVGPVVTLYSIELAPGIKAIRVINLSADVARLMKAFSVRISSIPGKNLLGVEISNPKRQFVYFKEGVQSDKYRNFEGDLPLYLGCNIYGEHEVFDLSTMPHLLVAGTTGSGKSVGIHTMLLSLLFKKTYEEVKLILIDPKKLELTPYKDIPYLLLPIVTEAKDAIRAVKWAVNEMESRYKAMSKMGVRNITSYNSKILELKINNEDTYEKFNYIVIVIDELADLMLLAGKEFEFYIQRLAQMGRAAGVHMIIATQRPSVDVITGTIKANFPTRVSFKLSTKIDSRTILGDMSGAEQLLGAGDMLYLGNNGKLTRIHGSYVSEDDVLLVVDFFRTQATPKYIELDFIDVDDQAMGGGLGVNEMEEDPIYDEAVRLIKLEKKVSTSFLQRCFPIGYNRAAKLIERMEKEQIITKGDRFGRNREIL